MSNKKQHYSIGIDLGTTYSCVGVWKNDIVEIIANDQGNRITPSYVTVFNDNNNNNKDDEAPSYLVGEAAKSQALTNLSNTVFDTKRLIGRNFHDASVQSDMKHWPFKVVPASGNDNNDDADDTGLFIEVEYMGKVKKITAESVSSMILSKMKDIAESYLGDTVTDAVITVPAHFNNSQRQATKDAGRIAGLNVLHIINEPTAAAFAYGLQQADKEEEQNVLVFDLGGGTFDVSLLSIEDGVFDVRATAGDTHLGGEDFDNRLVEYCIKQFYRSHPAISSSSTNEDNFLFLRNSLHRLRTACERAKRRLSASTQVLIEVERFDGGDIDLSLSISRAKFEDLCSDLFQKCLETVEQVLEDANIKKSKVQEIVLVGGSTRIPKIQSMLSEHFDGQKLNNSINPDEAIAYGAAVQAAILSSGNTASAASGSNKLMEVILLDVASHSLGMETGTSKTMSRFIKRNTKLPTKKTRTMTTYADNQTTLVIQIYEGEDPLTKNNHLLGKFTLDGIPPMPASKAQIDVCFEVDTNGVLQVSAVEKSTPKKQITITNESRRRYRDNVVAAATPNEEGGVTVLAEKKDNGKEKDEDDSSNKQETLTRVSSKVSNNNSNNEIETEGVWC